MQSTTIRIDAVLARNIRSFAALCAIVAAPVGGATKQADADYQPDKQQSVSTPESVGTPQSKKRKLIRSWQGYFRALRTLEYAWEMKGNHRGDAISENAFRCTFLWEGGRFRLDTERPGTKQRMPFDVQSTLLTADGKFYRTLETSRSGKRKFSLVDRPARPVGNHEMPLPLLHAFSFVFEEDKDSYTIEALQKDDIWQRFEKRITNIERGTWQGRRGQWLFVEHPEYAEQVKIFVDDANTFPLYVMGLTQYQLEGKNDTSDMAHDSQVTQIMQWRDGKTTYVFPLRIVQRGWSKDVVGGAIKRTSFHILHETTAPVKINQPLKPERFHIDIPAGTEVWYVPGYNSKTSGRPYPFAYDPKGGSLWAQEQRERQRIAALPKPYDEKANGKTQVEQALEQAKANNKRVLLQFGANWCGPCRKLHNLFKQNSEIASALQQGFVKVNIDGSQKHNANLVEEYRGPGQSGIPFLVVLEADGTRLATPPTESFHTSKEVTDFDPTKIAAFLSQWKPEANQAP